MTATKDTPAPPSLADAVNARLAALGMSRNQLANTMDVGWPTVQRLCDGRTRAPNHITIARLERALGWPAGYAETMVPPDLHRGCRPGPRRTIPWQAASSPSSTPRQPVPEHRPSNVMHLDVPPVATAPPEPAGELALPDPALRWRSPRNLAGRVEQVERWTYALAVARILVKEAEAPA